MARVLILHNDPVLPPDDTAADSEREVLATVAAVEAVLSRAGVQYIRLGLGREFGVLSEFIEKTRPRVVFNLFEGFADQPRSEAVVAEMLEELGVAFTGCPAQALRVAGAKHVAKRLFIRAGLPTPRYGVLWSDTQPLPTLEWPVIVKPALVDASLGIDQESVVCDPAALRRKVGHVLTRFGPPILVEEFVTGREFSLTLIECPELVVLPITEIVFTGARRWPIFSYEGKWRPGTEEYAASPEGYPARLDREFAARLDALARCTFRLFRCRDHARVDFRVTPAGAPSILELNPNPDLSPDAYLGASIGAGDLDYDQLILQMIDNAIRRCGDSSETVPRFPVLCESHAAHSESR